MTNFFLQIWIFIKYLPVKLKHWNIKLILVTILIILLTRFYIKSQDVHTEEVSLKIERVAGVDSTRTFNILCSVDGSIMDNRDKGDAVNAVQLAVESASSAPIFTQIADSRVDSLRRSLLQYNNAAYVNTVNLLYDVEFTRAIPSYMGHPINKNMIDEEDPENDDARSFNLTCSSSVETYGTRRNFTTKGHVVWGINNAATTPLYGITTKPFDIYSPIDLSQLYYSFKLSLKFNEVVTSAHLQKSVSIQKS
jgi:hypothetical protein